MESETAQGIRGKPARVCSVVMEGAGCEQTRCVSMTKAEEATFAFGKEGVCLCMCVLPVLPLRHGTALGKGGHSW